jgi:hypothetical protein
MVCVPTGKEGKEMVLHLAAELLPAAFNYAAKARQTRGN